MARFPCPTCKVPPLDLLRTLWLIPLQGLLQIQSSIHVLTLFQTL